MASLPSNTLEITETKKLLKPIAADTKDKKRVFDEIVDWAKILTKAAAQGSPDTIKSILKEIQSGLGSGIKVGEEWIDLEELLRSTKIGIIVNHQRQHPSGEVASLATYLVKKWRDDMKGAKKSRKKGLNGTASPAPSSDLSNGKPKLHVPPAEREWKNDKVDVNLTRQATRNGCIGLLYNGLCYMSEKDSSEILSKAVAIEAAGFTRLGSETNPGYSSKMRSLFINLKNKSNPQLRERVLSGEITPDNLVIMSTEDLKSDTRKLEDAKLIKENLKDAQMPSVERSIVRLPLTSPSSSPVRKDDY